MKLTLDKYNLIVQNYYTKDGGDSAQREGLYYSINYLLGGSVKASYQNTINHLKGTYGRWRRNPDPKMWYSDWWRFSRDQATTNVIAMGLLKYEWELFIYMLWHMARFGMMTNIYPNWVKKEDAKLKFPDFTGPEFWGLYIRGLRLWPLYPLLLLSDLEILIGSMIRRRNKDKDVSNHTLIVIYSRYRMPTPLWPLIKWANDKEDLKEKLGRYFDGNDSKFFSEKLGILLDKCL